MPPGLDDDGLAGTCVARLLEKGPVTSLFFMVFRVSSLRGVGENGWQGDNMMMSPFIDGGFFHGWESSGSIPDGFFYRLSATFAGKAVSGDRPGLESRERNRLFAIFTDTECALFDGQ